MFLFSQKKQEKVPPTVQTIFIPPAGGEEQGMSFALANLQGIGNRQQQEDAFAFGNALDEKAIAQRGLLAVVADGMGGMEGGRVAGMTAVAEILKAFERFEPKGDLPAQLNEAIWQANEAVYDKLGGYGGSTAVLGLVYQEKLYYSGVGDSYVFLMHGRVLTQLNERQTVLNRDLKAQIREGRIDLEEARQNPENHAVTQFLGMPDDPETDFLHSPLKLEPGDVILLCSDGVGGVLEPGCIEKCLCQGNPDEMCASLDLEIQNKKLKYQDNYTALIIQCRK